MLKTILVFSIRRRLPIVETNTAQKVANKIGKQQQQTMKPVNSRCRMYTSVYPNVILKHRQTRKNRWTTIGQQVASWCHAFNVKASIRSRSSVNWTIVGQIVRPDGTGWPLKHCHFLFAKHPIWFWGFEMDTHYRFCVQFLGKKGSMFYVDTLYNWMLTHHRSNGVSSRKPQIGIPFHTVQYR